MKWILACVLSLVAAVSCTGCATESNNPVRVRNECGTAVDAVLVFGVRRGPGIKGIVGGEGGVYAVLPPGKEAELGPDMVNMNFHGGFSSTVLMVRRPKVEWQSYSITEPTRRDDRPYALTLVVRCVEDGFALTAGDTLGRTHSVRLIDAQDGGTMWRDVQEWQRRMETGGW